MGDIPGKERAVAISTRQCLKLYWGLPLCERVAALSWQNSVASESGVWQKLSGMSGLTSSCSSSIFTTPSCQSGMREWCLAAIIRLGGIYPFLFK